MWGALADPMLLLEEFLLRPGLGHPDLNKTLCVEGVADWSANESIRKLLAAEILSQTGAAREPDKPLKAIHG